MLSQSKEVYVIDVAMINKICNGDFLVMVNHLRFTGIDTYLSVSYTALTIIYFAIAVKYCKPQHDNWSTLSKWKSLGLLVHTVCS